MKYKKRKNAIAFLLFFSLLNLCIPAESTAQSQKAEFGIATYYGDKFNGRHTASGEIFDNKKFTAAHRTHPFGTQLLVTNLKNNKTVVVTVNDRGPFSAGRVIDVTKAAAAQLDFVAAGITNVKIELYIEKTDSLNIPDSVMFDTDLKKVPDSGFAIVVDTLQGSDTLMARMKFYAQKYNCPVSGKVYLKDKQRFYIILLGPFTERGMAEEKLEILKREGISGLLTDLNTSR